MVISVLVPAFKTLYIYFVADYCNKCPFFGVYVSKEKKRKEINDLMGFFMGAHQQVKVARKTHREINVVNCGPVNCSSQFNENTLIFKII